MHPGPPLADRLDATQGPRTLATTHTAACAAEPVDGPDEIRRRQSVTFPDRSSAFEAITSHTSQPDWTPPATPTLWKCIGGACAIRSLGACVLAKSDDGTFRAAFSYDNGLAVNTFVPVGPFNRFTPSPEDRGQPRGLIPGRHAFVVGGGPGTLTWRLGAAAVSIDATGAACTTRPGAPGQGDVVVIVGSEFTLRPDPGRTVGNSIVAPDNDGSTVNPRTVGTIGASFSVSEDGGATYQIPIWVSPGRAGVQPNLALHYNSQNASNHGPLGIGWTLTGLSQIRLCPKTLVHDGDPAPVKFDRTDTYCLDGERLVPITDEGAATVEYRTQKDIFAKIVATMGEHGAESFQVFLQKGRIRSYGSDPTNTQSRLEGRIQEGKLFGQQRVLAWGLDREEDRSGNFSTVTYNLTTLDLDFGGSAVEWHPVRIDYTGNNQSGRTPDRSVELVYNGVPEALPSRPDHTTDFVSGFRTENTTLLGQIRINGPGADGASQLLKFYSLRYFAFPASGAPGATGGSRFVRCRFSGELREVIFHRTAWDAEHLAPNEMTDVDFSQARLRFVEFRGLGLRSVRWPIDDVHVVVQNYRGVLDVALRSFESRGDRGSQGLAAYLEVYRKWAGPNQEVGIFNREDLREAGGVDAASEFLQLVDSAKQREGF